MEMYSRIVTTLVHCRVGELDQHDQHAILYILEGLIVDPHVYNHPFVLLIIIPYIEKEQGTG